MKVFYFILLLAFLICPNGFCQSGQTDGIHKEFYANGKLKTEYMVKNEKLNGFYERYDEQGILEYREYYIEGIYDGTDRNDYYYPLFTWYHHIGDEAEEVVLDIEKALELFEEEYELRDEPFDGNWMGIIRTRVPADGENKERFPVTLAGISRRYIYLKEFKERADAGHREHYYYDLIRKYKIERNDDIDRLFNVDLIEAVFKRRHTGIEFGTPFGRWKAREGSRLRSVQQYLGDPDYSRKLKPVGWFDVYYADENVRIIGHNSAVYFLEEGRPEWAGSSEHW